MGMSNITILVPKYTNHNIYIYYVYIIFIYIYIYYKCSSGKVSRTQKQNQFRQRLCDFFNWGVPTNRTLPSPALYRLVVDLAVRRFLLLTGPLSRVQKARLLVSTIVLFIVGELKLLIQKNMWYTSDPRLLMLNLLDDDGCNPNTYWIGISHLPSR